MLEKGPRCCILICRCMQNHNDDTIKTSRHSSFEKYTSHFIERVVCERELETEQNCNILTPKLFWLSQPFFPVLLGCSIGGLGPSLSWDMVLIPPSSLQLIWTSCRRGYIIVLRPLNSTRRQSRPSPDLLISSTGCTCYLHRCISYFDSLAGSEVNMQHQAISAIISTISNHQYERDLMPCRSSLLIITPWET